MSAMREQQLEALAVAAEYLDKLIPSMKQVISEINGQMQEDTVDFLHQIVDGLNFMIETYNVTKDVINTEGPLINEDVFEECVGRMSKGFENRDYKAIAKELEESIVPFLLVFREASKQAVS